MTDRYENIRRALEMGPTPNEWYWTDEYTARDGSKTWSLIGDRGVGILSCDGKENSPKSADAAYIAACDPDTIRELLEERDALREALEDIRSRSCMNLAMNPNPYELTAMLGDIHQIADAALVQEGKQ